MKFPPTLSLHQFPTTTIELGNTKKSAVKVEEAKMENSIQSYERLEEPSNKLKAKIKSLNNYLETALSKNSDLVSENAKVIEEENFSWNNIAVLIRNVKMYVKKAKAYKGKLRELKSTKDNFIKYMETQVTELNKNWSLVKDQEKENHEIVKHIAKKSENPSAIDIQKQVLKQEIQVLRQDEGLLRANIESLKGKCKEYDKEKRSLEVIIENCKRIVKVRMSEIQESQKEFDTLEANKKQLAAELETLNDEIAVSRLQLNKLKNEISSARNSLNKLAEEKGKVSRLKETELELRERLANLEIETVNMEKRLKINNAKEQMKLEYIDNLIKKKNEVLAMINRKIIEGKENFAQSQ
eukprot:TRINITY_DN15276_c0_g3_i1.p1 TRINITY_DN15276_c0_g3~~TRINITY_DN15276_c0_g3_i1.p1  ORF type:complete len:354 (-),score=92.53 TRINITY_DN15276_c0_g3_i1:125-1186(-)